MSLRTIMTAAILCVGLQAGVALPAAGQAASKVDAFYGHYVGTGATREGARHYAVDARDLDVTIEAAPDGGFTIKSSVEIARGLLGGGKKRREATMTFTPTSVPNLWQAKASKPLSEGGPTILARLDDKVLSVHVVTLARNGDLVTALYRRELKAPGMWLVYRRVRNGVVTRRVFGTLEKK